jgi:hypothetical protein
MAQLLFEEIPRLIQELQQKVDRQTRLLEQIVRNNLPETDTWFDVDQLSKYLPDHPVKKTIYKKVEQNIIPYHRRSDGKTLYFLKSEIDLYLKEGKQKSRTEIEEEVDDLLSNTKVVRARKKDRMTEE